jgi:nucleoside-diphosphate-sugar epimerase
MQIERQNMVRVTGANGFVGRAVTRLLERSGRKIVPLDVTPEAVPSSESATKVVCDISFEEELELVFAERDISAINHLTAVFAYGSTERSGGCHASEPRAA